MIACQLMSHGFSRSTVQHATASSERDAGHASVARPAASAPIATRFQPLDPGVLSEAIPAFFIGRNSDGFWVARDAKGRIGGLFLLESSALSFAQQRSAAILDRARKALQWRPEDPHVS